MYPDLELVGIRLGIHMYCCMLDPFRVERSHTQMNGLIPSNRSSYLNERIGTRLHMMLDLMFQNIYLL